MSLPSAFLELPYVVGDACIYIKLIRFSQYRSVYLDQLKLEPWFVNAFIMKVLDQSQKRHYTFLKEIIHGIKQILKLCGTRSYNLKTKNKIQF